LPRPELHGLPSGPWHRPAREASASLEPCGRCVVTTTDQITGERGKQPLKMLGRRRRFGQELVFGQNLIPDSGGVIRIGDPVEILDAA
jgi:uncharacterized protein